MHQKLFTCCVVLALSGCAMQREGYLYSPTGPGRGTLVFSDALENRGDVQASLADGEHCHGRYTTVPGREVTWDDEKINQIYSEDTQAGMAILECASGHVLRCDFSRAKAGAGMGQCVDTRGNKQTLYF